MCFELPLLLNGKAHFQKERQTAARMGAHSIIGSFGARAKIFRSRKSNKLKLASAKKILARAIVPQNDPIIERVAIFAPVGHLFFESGLFLIGRLPILRRH